MGLNLRRRERTPDAPRSAVQRRAARIPTPDLTGWADQALTALGRSLRDWQRTQADEALAEAEMGAEALLEVVRELRRRTTAG